MRVHRMVRAGARGGDDLPFSPGPVQPMRDALRPGFDWCVMTAGGDKEKPARRDQRCSHARHPLIGAEAS